MGNYERKKTKWISHFTREPFLSDEISSSFGAECTAPTSESSTYEEDAVEVTEEPDTSDKAGKEICENVSQIEGFQVDSVTGELNPIPGPSKRIERTPAVMQTPLEQRPLSKAGPENVGNKRSATAFTETPEENFRKVAKNISPVKETQEPDELLKKSAQDRYFCTVCSQLFYESPPEEVWLKCLSCKLWVHRCTLVSHGYYCDECVKCFKQKRWPDGFYR